MKLLLAADMALGEALLNSVLGMAVVFVALIFLMTIIYVQSKALKRRAKVRTAAEAPAPSAPQPQPSPAPPVHAAPSRTEAKPNGGPPAPGSAGSLVLRDVSERDAALLMAIVAHQMGLPLNQLRFSSIKHVMDREDVIR